MFYLPQKGCLISYIRQKGNGFIGINYSFELVLFYIVDFFQGYTVFLRDWQEFCRKH